MRIVTKEELKNIVVHSYSKAEVLRKLKFPQNGNYHNYVSKLLNEFEIDTTHFCAGTILRRKYQRVKKICPICGQEFEVLSGSPKEKIVCGRACSNTLFRSGENNGNWLGGHGYRAVCFRYWPQHCIIPNCDWKLTVDVHHIDEDRSNNKPENLVPLCPNHHSLFRYEEYKDRWNKILQELIFKNTKLLTSYIE